jgi:hypothetical protein
LYGIPFSEDNNTDDLQYNIGAIIHQPVYTCASSVKATIKTVEFMLNGTASLSNLIVTKVIDKDYPNSNSEPIWGVENPVLPQNISNIDLLWGLVNKTYVNDPEISTIQAKDFYLPAAYFSTDMSTFKDSLASASVFTSAWNSVYDEAAWIAGASVGGLPSYSGNTQYSLFLKWRNLSSTEEGAGNILNLIWTDLVASAVVGTVTGFEDNASMTRAVRKNQFVVSYDNLLFAIPAFLTAFLWVVLFVIALILLLSGKASYPLLLHYMNQTSLGRAVYDATHREKETGNLPSEDWSKEIGDQIIELRGFGKKVRSSAASRQSHSQYAAV